MYIWNKPSYVFVLILYMSLGASFSGLSSAEYTYDDRGVPRSFCNECECDKYLRPKDKGSLKCANCGHNPPQVRARKLLVLKKPSYLFNELSIACIFY